MSLEIFVSLVMYPSISLPKETYLGNSNISHSGLHVVVDH